MGIGRASCPWTALEHLLLTVVLSQLVLIFLVVFVFTEDCHSTFFWSPVSQCFGAVLNQNPSPSLCKEWETCAMGIGRASWPLMALEHLLLTVLLSHFFLFFLWFLFSLRIATVGSSGLMSLRSHCTHWRLQEDNLFCQLATALAHFFFLWTLLLALPIQRW